MSESSAKQLVSYTKTKPTALSKNKEESDLIQQIVYTLRIFTRGESTEGEKKELIKRVQEGNVIENRLKANEKEKKRGLRNKAIKLWKEIRMKDYLQTKK